MKNAVSSLTKTLLLTLCLSLGGGYMSFVIQTNANEKVSACSYLDPISIDILAFGSAVFLLIEGLASIWKHKKSKVLSQLTRCIRVCIGTSILVIHTMQFLHK